MKARRLGTRALVVASSFLVFGAQSLTTSSLVLPLELSGYRSWPAATSEPIPVPLQLWLACSRPTTQQRAEAYRAHGVHAERYIRVYASPGAAVLLPDTVHRAFPIGSVIAKEKLANLGDKSPEGVAFMVRRAEPRFRESGGWEFLYFPAQGNKAEVHQACAECHRSSPTGDFVLGHYPRETKGATGRPDATHGLPGTWKAPR